MGESIANKYLTDYGYEVKKRNFHFGKLGEIDIVCMKDDVLIFVEVKTRTNDEYGDPLYSITPGKVKKLRIAAKGYIKINKMYDRECRFDVITVDMRQNPPKLKHLKNAF